MRKNRWMRTRTIAPSRGSFSDKHKKSLALQHIVATRPSRHRPCSIMSTGVQLAHGGRTGEEGCASLPRSPSMTTSPLRMSAPPHCTEGHACRRRTEVGPIPPQPEWNSLHDSQRGAIGGQNPQRGTVVCITAFVERPAGAFCVRHAHSLASSL